MQRHDQTTPTLSTVIGSYNRLPFLKRALRTLREELGRCPFSSEIIVVDGGSDDGTLKWLLKQKDIVSIVQHNRGVWQGKAIERRSWGYFMNLGFKCARGKYVCMLSDDCLVVPGAIAHGVALFDDRLAAGEKVGAVAFYWRNWPEQQKYWVGFTFGDSMFVNHGLYLNEALQRVGYADEKTYAFYHADGDLCLRMMQQGYQCLPSPHSFVEHHSHANVPLRAENCASQQRDWAAYEERWGHLGHPQSDWLEQEHQDVHCTVRSFPGRWF